MQTISMTECRIHFYAIVRRVMNGESFIITYGRKKEPVAMLVPFEAEEDKGPRKLGSGKVEDDSP